VTFARGTRLGPHRRLDGPPKSKVPYLLLLVPVLIALLGALAGWHIANAGNTPKVLASYRAAGPRDEANCLRIVLGVDVSGSMSDFSDARDDALVQLFAWLKKNLRPDDEVAIIDFAAVANVRMQPAQVASLRGLPPAFGATDGTYTYFDPVLTDIGEFMPTSCDTALLLLSDAQLIDLPGSRAAGQQLLRHYHVDRIRLLVPGAAIQVGSGWVNGFPAAVPLVFDGLDPEATGLALGKTIVGLTGQTLEPIH
jgi:hypothetical protein